MNEKRIKMYLEKYNEEFVKRYILKCLSREIPEKFENISVEYVGSEIRTGVGLHRADMVYYIKSYTPIIIVVELKTEVGTDAIAQVQNYIKEFKKTKKLEKEKNRCLPCNYMYCGIVVGKWVKPIVKKLIESDISNKLSYIEFRNNEYKCMDEDMVYYYTDKDYWFECGMF